MLGRGGVHCTVERDAEPIFQAAVEFLVLHVEAKHI